MSEHQQEELIGREALAETREDSDLNAPVEWAGLPAFHPIPERRTQLVLSFDTDEQRDELIAQLGIVVAKKTGKTWSAWWPPREREDLAALRFDFDAPERRESEEPPRTDRERFGASPGAESLNERAEEAGMDPHTFAAAEDYGREIEEEGGL